MLKLRVIPILLWDGMNLIKGVGFNKERRIGSVLPAIRVFNNRLVDELVFFDVAATPENRSPDVEVVSMIAQNLFVPLTVGGGIKSIEHMRQLFSAGADKICLNSVLFDNPKLLNEAVAIFGSQSIVVAIDFERREDDFYCVRHSGAIKTKITVSEWINFVQEAGAGEIILTSIDRDGTFSGYELDLIKLIKNEIRVPVILGGGFSCPKDALDALEIVSLAGFGIGSAFFFTEQTPEMVREYLKQAQYPVRIIGNQL